MKRVGLPFLLAFAAAAGCAERSTPPVILHAIGDTAACHIEWDGRSLTLDELLVVARSWRGRTAHIEAGIDTPYKCIGSVIYTLQRAGVRKVGFTPVIRTNE